MSPSRVDPAILATFPGAPTSRRGLEALRAHPCQRPMDAGVVDGLVAFLRHELTRMQAVGLQGLTIGLTGGLDSVVAARLCQLACEGEHRLMAVTVDLGRHGEAERQPGIAKCARDLGLDHTVIDGAATRREFLAASPEQGLWSGINTDTRLILDFIARVADARSSAVVCTTDLSEQLLGRQTEGFYGQVAPLGSLYKTEVLALAQTLGVAELLADSRPGCEDYWYDDEVLGVRYDVIDPLLQLLAHEKRPTAWVAQHFGVEDAAWLERVAHRIEHQPARLLTRAPTIPVRD
jgi:NAD+ synthase